MFKNRRDKKHFDTIRLLLNAEEDNEDSCVENNSKCDHDLSFVEEAGAAPYDLDIDEHTTNNEVIECTDTNKSCCSDNAKSTNFSSHRGKELQQQVSCNPSYYESGKRWQLILHCKKVPHARKKKTWKRIVVRLEGNSLSFHAEDFESSSPFKVVHLDWFHSFTLSRKSRLIHTDYVFMAILENTLQKKSGAKSRGRIKLGCTNSSILKDFIRTVEDCISSFPSFRPAGISYKREKVSFIVYDTYDYIQKDSINLKIPSCDSEHENIHGVVYETREECHFSLKQVKIMMKARVSASPECRTKVRHSEKLSKKPCLEEIRFHKCVKSFFSRKQTTTAAVLPLDNTWFQLMSWQGYSSKLPPLHCEVKVHKNENRNCLHILAQLFTSSTRLDLKSAKNIVVRLHIPSKFLKTYGKETACETVKRHTRVSKGDVFYNTRESTMFWLLPKIVFKSYRHFHLVGKPLASLESDVHLQNLCHAQRLVQKPLDMDFCAKGSVESSEVSISSLKIGLKSFGKFSTMHRSLYHVKIPVTFDA